MKRIQVRLRFCKYTRNLLGLFSPGRASPCKKVVGVNVLYKRGKGRKLIKVFVKEINDACILCKPRYFSLFTTEGVD